MGREGNQDRNSKQESGDRNRGKDYGGVLLTGLLPMALLSWLSYRTQDAPSDGITYRVHRGSPSPLTNQEHALTDLPGDSPSLEIPSFQMTLVCVKLTKN